MTILLTPYMSCSAKIPIYAVFTAAFFTKYRALVMIGLYATGILLGIIVALILKRTAFRGEPVPFVMELPNYRMPSPKSVFLLLWEKARDFLQRAFTVIFIATIIIWFLQSFDTRLNVVDDSADSLLAMIGKFIAPIFKPLGFGDWRAVTALISGFTAKEAVVSTLSVLMNTGTAQLGSVLPSLFTGLSAVSFLVFTLLYTPCVAAVATIKKELGSRIKTVGVVFMQCAVAYIASFIVYSVGGFLYEYRRHCDYLHFGGGCGGGNGLYSQAPQKRQVYSCSGNCAACAASSNNKNADLKSFDRNNKKGTVKTAVFTAPFFLFNLRAYFFS